jgi:hypothetical protein
VDAEILICCVVVQAPRISTVGPLVEGLGEGKLSLRQKLQETAEAGECFDWLNEQSDSSVLYICFGTVAMVSDAQIREMAVAVQNSGQRFFWVMRIPKDEAGKPVREDYSRVLPDGVCGEDEGDGVGVPGLGSAAARPGAPCGPGVREPLRVELHHREHLGGRPDDRMAVPGGPDDERHPAGPASGRRHPHQQHRRVAGHDPERGFREGDSGPDGGAGRRRHEGESGADQRHD